MSTFDLPVSEHQSTKGARRGYFETWGRKWPHDDKYLRLLAKEVEDRNETRKCAALILRMRENHEFN